MKTTKNFSYVVTLSKNFIFMDDVFYNCISNAIKSAKEQLVAKSLFCEGDFALVSIKPNDGEHKMQLFTMHTDGKSFIQKHGFDSSRPCFAPKTRKAKPKDDDPDEGTTPDTEQIQWNLSSLRQASDLHVICFDDSGEKLTVCVENTEKRCTIAYLNKTDGKLEGYLMTKDGLKVRTFAYVPKQGYNWKV